MIKTIKENILKYKIQCIKITKEGVVLESENNLFTLESGSSIFNFDPFFESIHYYFNEKEEQVFKLSCVNLELHNKKVIYDIDVHVYNSFVVLAIFDFSEHYKLSNNLSQERNESVIEGQMLKEQEALKKQVLLNFKISGTGIGIPKKHLDSIFTSFIQINKTTKNDGIGLGLAIVSHLVRLMDGNVSAENVVG